MDLEIQKAWDKTCTLLLGEPLGPIEEYSDWLKGLIDRNTYSASNISGKEVAFAVKEYSENSKFIGFDEIDFHKKFEPLNINEIKDIDSIIQAVSDRAYYCGNIVLGNCKNVERSSNLSDAFYVSDSAQFFSVKNMAYCTVGRENSYCFGTHGAGGSDFLIRCSQATNVRRSFELWVSTNSSDGYYSYGLDACSNCLFSFNLRNKQYHVGNLQLSKDKFSEIKKKLMADLTEEIKRKKSTLSLLDIINKSTLEVQSFDAPIESEERLDKKIIEKEFSDTTQLLFGKALTGIDNYSNWLNEHVHKIHESRSSLSGKRILWLPYGISILPMPEDRFVTISEAKYLGENTRIEKTEAETMRFSNAHERIGKIAYLNVDMRAGENTNLIDCTFCIQCSHCYQISMTPYTKYCACGMWPKGSSNCFGMDSLMDSAFSIKCYHSARLTRCFEMDNCRDCADSMFCHNCENLSNCMFCFNVKSKRYAIANIELDRDEYFRLKKIIMGEIVKKLERDKRLDMSIYNVGCWSRKQSF